VPNNGGVNDGGPDGDETDHGDDTR
jgi:hypothetical protein